VCEYPTRPEKPGPKAGSSQRSKRRKLQHDPKPPDISNSSRDLLLLSTAAAQLSPANPTQRHNPEPTLSPTRGGGLSQHALLTQDDIHSHEVVSNSLPSAGGPPSDDQPGSVPIFSRIMYPSHESQTRPQSPSTAGASPENQNGVTGGTTVRSVCVALHLSRATYNLLSVDCRRARSPPGAFSMQS
jgi:hypothetical protein